MTMSILDTMQGGGDGVYYTDSFRAVFEDHIEYLRNNAVLAGGENQSLQARTAIIYPVSAEDAYWYRYRPYQYLSDKFNIEPEQWWFVLRLSRLSGPELFNETVREIYVPDITFLKQLASTHMTTFTTV